MKRIITLLTILTIAACTSGVRKGGSIHGRVTDSSGSAVSGATITLKPEGTSHAVVSGADGRFRFTHVPPGDYVLLAERSGLVASRQRIVVISGSTTQVASSLRPATVSEPMAVSKMEYGMAQAQVRRVGGGVLGGLIGGVPGGMVVEENSDAQYSAIQENVFHSAREKPTTTFAIDVDRASYANVRRFLAASTLPNPHAVRVEEMINYFDYHLPPPTGADPFSITTEVASCPWNPKARLLRIGIQGKNIDEWKMAPNHLVFLLDVSGSMAPPERLPLLKSAFRILVDQLRVQDTVAIVVYAGNAGLVLPPTSGSDKSMILSALDNLQSGGSTAGGAGIELAYRIARENFVDGANNRVILATDGDFNVGVSSNEQLERIIEEKRKEGIFLTTIGVGTNNYHDARMEMLADKGNGNYFYLDGIDEARKVFKTELMGTLVVIAKDVKVQLEFNPELVARYRQVGYENRALENKDFEDDTKDAGELGAGHCVTVLYEFEPRGAAGEIARIRLRYKQPAGDTSALVTAAARDEGKSIYESSDDLKWAAAIAEFAMLLRNSEHKGTASYAGVLALAKAARGPDPDGFREEFTRLVDTALTLTSAPIASQ